MSGWGKSNGYWELFVPTQLSSMYLYNCSELHSLWKSRGYQSSLITLLILGVVAQVVERLTEAEFMLTVVVQYTFGSRVLFQICTSVYGDQGSTNISIFTDIH